MVIFFFLWRNSPTGARAAPFLRFVDDTVAHHSQSCKYLYLKTHNTHNRQTSMPPAGFEPALPASERPLGSATIGMRIRNLRRSQGRKTGKTRSNLHRLSSSVSGWLRCLCSAFRNTQVFRRVRKIAKGYYQLRHVCLSVRMEQLVPNWTHFGETWYLSFFFENLSRKFRFYCNLTRITGTLHEDVSSFMKISCWILLRMRKFSNKSCRENHNIFYVQ